MHCNFPSAPEDLGGDAADGVTGNLATGAAGAAARARGQARAQALLAWLAERGLQHRPCQLWLGPAVLPTLCSPYLHDLTPQLTAWAGRQQLAAPALAPPAPPAAHALARRAFVATAAHALAAGHADRLQERVAAEADGGIHRVAALGLRAYVVDLARLAPAWLPAADDALPAAPPWSMAAEAPLLLSLAWCPRPDLPPPGRWPQAYAPGTETAALLEVLLPALAAHAVGVTVLQPGHLAAGGPQLALATALAPCTRRSQLTLAAPSDPAGTVARLAQLGTTAAWGSCAAHAGPTPAPGPQAAAAQASCAPIPRGWPAPRHLGAVGHGVQVAETLLAARQCGLLPRHRPLTYAVTDAAAPLAPWAVGRALLAQLLRHGAAAVPAPTPAAPPAAPAGPLGRGRGPLLRA